ncbi:hypothetical protein M9Y10_003233 [Tritrichomonas musculus]|uniref:Uncharacterized protein n=1 Tax=Tritrichomonas musculus TaxID=1915356 RepID=A0ABR2JP63_9EUKA
MIKRRRRIEFDVYIFKVLKSYFQIHGGKLEDPILTDELYNKFYQDDIKEEYAKEPRWKWIANFTVIDWISEEGDLRGFFDAVNTAMKSWIAIHGEYAKVFSQNDSFVVYRDIQTDGYYDKDGFHEIVFTRNNDLDDDSQQYINFFQITNWNDDFADVFNIGTGSFQNNPKKYKTWMLEKEPFGKRRNNVTKEAYTVDSKKGNQFLVRSKDGSTSSYPGYRLIRTRDQRVKLADTLNGGKEGIIERIDNYNDDTGKNKVKYEGVVGRKAFAQEPIRNLRRGNPLVLGPAEREYWLSYTKKAGKEIPDRIKKYI